MNSSLGATRRLVPRALAAAALVALAAAGGFAVWLATRPSADELLADGLAAAESDPIEAQHLLRQAVKRTARAPDAELGLAFVLARQDDWDGAARLFEKVDKSKCRSDLLVKYGQEAMRAGRLEETVAALEPASRKDEPASIIALTGLVAAYGKLNRQEELIAASGELARRQPDDPSHWRDYIELLKAAHLETECLAAVRAALTHQPSQEMEIAFRFRLVEQLMIQGDSSGAWKEIATIERLEGDSLRLATKKIDLYRLDGRIDEALAAIQAVFPAVGHLSVARLTRGAVYLDAGRYEEAKRDLEQVVAAEPYNEGAHFKLSQAYRLLGDEAKAKHHVDINLDIRKKRIRINDLLKQQDAAPLDSADCREVADLYRSLGELPAAENWSRRALLAGR